MYIMLCGYPPFGGKTDEDILKTVALGEYTFPSKEWGGISAEAKTMIGKMLSP
jgi:calcium-dependent protein kinase